MSTLTSPLVYKGQIGGTIRLPHSVAGAAMPNILPSFPVLVVFDTCVGVTIAGGGADCAGFNTGFIGLLNCTDCVVDSNVCEHSAANAQFASLGGMRNRWVNNSARNGAGACRGFWLGNTHAGEIERDVQIFGNEAINNQATGIVLVAAGAQVSDNLALNNRGSGIIASSAAGVLSFDHLIRGNVCRGNSFWGWQSDVADTGHVDRVRIIGNNFSGNTAGSALLNVCNDFVYGANIEDGVIQYLACNRGVIETNNPSLLNTSGAPSVSVVIR